MSSLHPQRGIFQITSSGRERIQSKRNPLSAARREAGRQRRFRSITPLQLCYVSLPPAWPPASRPGYAGPGSAALRPGERLTAAGPGRGSRHRPKTTDQATPGEGAPLRDARRLGAAATGSSTGQVLFRSPPLGPAGSSARSGVAAQRRAVVRREARRLGATARW